MVNRYTPVKHLTKRVVTLVRDNACQTIPNTLKDSGHNSHTHTCKLLQERVTRWCGQNEQPHCSPRQVISCDRSTSSRDETRSRACAREAGRTGQDRAGQEEQGRAEARTQGRCQLLITRQSEPVQPESLVTARQTVASLRGLGGGERGDEKRGQH